MDVGSIDVVSLSVFHRTSGSQRLKKRIAGRVDVAIMIIMRLDNFCRISAHFLPVWLF